MNAVDGSSESAPKSKAQKFIFLGFLFCAFIGFIGLGTWQIYRLQWKNQLIESVEQRIHAQALPAPDASEWSRITAAQDAYRHISASGLLLSAHSVAVQATTELGPGFWLLTPLKQANGTIIYINRGFIKSGHPDLKPETNRSQEQVQFTGLLRISEPKGGFLRTNDPVNNRWYSRDIEAIANTANLQRVAPFFMDAQKAENSKDGVAFTVGPDDPVMGLTVVHFPNSHLVYAITWFALALMVLIAYWRIFLLRASSDS
ncbi:surfeit locus 1 family protein [Polynucleobacter meluiroseus]|uniref:SURF1-like protein n=1 Tax=Polynucleobacter meluiroseus TaxID=1938814 RepID=A0A240DYN5_9BURK|nr:SURF1 family protein [Polynucleobacter meluiroseus]SNX28077.1 surfeit locus 1 family protein [Polynucleobacter meluiroseus]